MSCSGETIEEDQIIQIKPMISQQLKKAKYGVSDHSTVALCHWTKKSFKHEGNCYKHKFYGILTHSCMEFSPAGMYCENRCVYCWRPMEFYESMKMESENVAEPKEIMSKLMEERKKLIMGHYGDSRSDKKRLDESLKPNHYAISLSGEPTMYPKLPELIKYLKSLKETLSTNASDYDSFLRINQPRYDDSWQRWNKTLDMLKHLDTRTVLRITLIRDYNNQKEMIPTFAKILEQSSPHFVEIKSYMHIGRSTNRLDHENMLEMEEIKKFSEDIAKQSKIFSVMDESYVSRIVVLQNNKRNINRFIPSYVNTN
jgi:tRNA wybutosine-synthesizing protein 1